MDKVLGTLGLCRKAGKLVWGFDAVAQAMREGQVELIVLAQDLSEKSAKEVRFLCKKHTIKAVTIPFTIEEIWFRLGKRTGILAVTDRGFAHTIDSAAICANEEE